MAPALDPALRAGPPRARYALLINPFYPKDPHASFGKHVLTPSLALTSIAGATPPDWEVAYWDENLLPGPPPSEPFPQVVGITVHLTFAERAYELARWYRERGAQVVLGGLHVLSCPEEAAPHADALAIGEGVQVWPEILRDVEAGTLRAVYRGSYRRPYRDDPPPRRDLLPRRGFLTTTSLIATRGCHNRCGFCYLATEGLTMPYQVRDVEQVVAEFRRRRAAVRRVHRQQPRLAARVPARTLPRPAAAGGDLERGRDDRRDRRSVAGPRDGAGRLHRASSSASSRWPARTSSRRARRPRARQTTRGGCAILHDHGIQVNGSFVLGFDHDRPDVFERTVAWIEAARLECATFHILTPYPGTPLFSQMESQGRLLHKDWRLYDTAHAVFRPRHMSPEELEAGYAWCYETLFSHRSIWRRRPADWRAVPAYLAMSYLYKRSNRFWHC